MPRQDSYGRILREAREREGFDLTTMARRMRIRPDILRAIEESDFDHMPAKGYTQNMVRAYARTVGLDQNAISKRYLDEMHLHDTGRPRAGSRSRGGAGADGYGRRPSSERPRRSGADPYGAVARPRRGQPPSRGGRPQQRPDRGERPRNGRRSGRGGGYGYVGQPRSAARASAPGRYPSIYSDARSQRSLPGLPIWLLIAAGVIIAIIVLIMLFNTGKQAVEEVPDIPISGLTDTSNPEGEPSADTASTPPQSAKVSFSVDSGSKSWIEVIQDDETVLSEVVSGPYTEDFDVDGTLTLRTANPEPVKMTVDGEEVELSRESGTEYYSCTVDFDEIKEAWEREHGSSSSSAASSSSSSSSRSSSSSSSREG